MAEKRKPDYIILLRKTSKDKPNKVELFRASQWGNTREISERRFRMRVNGRWYPKDKKGRYYYYKSEIFNLISKSWHI